MKKIFNEFKTFALKGSVIDLAVGIIIGASFNAIVKSLVSDIMTPPIGWVLHRVDFSQLYINLSTQKFASFAEAQKAGVPTINYGTFINALISFLITAWVVFLLVKLINRLRAKEEAHPTQVPSEKTCPFCISKVPIKAIRCPFCTSELNS